MLLLSTQRYLANRMTNKPLILTKAALTISNAVAWHAQALKMLDVAW